jgi:hypothetical protein
LIFGDRNSVVIKLRRQVIFIGIPMQGGHGILVFLNERCVREGGRSPLIKEALKRRVT